MSASLGRRVISPQSATSTVCLATIVPRATKMMSQPLCPALAALHSEGATRKSREAAGQTVARCAAISQ